MTKAEATLRSLAPVAGAMVGAWMGESAWTAGAGAAAGSAAALLFLAVARHSAAQPPKA